MENFIQTFQVSPEVCDGLIEYHKNKSENWKISLVDTGVESMTGGRVNRCNVF